MNCPLCDVKMLTKDKRNDRMLVRRRLECGECLTTFHTTEKINYERLPRYVLDKLHEKVESKK